MRIKTLFGLCLVLAGFSSGHAASSPLTLAVFDFEAKDAAEDRPETLRWSDPASPLSEKARRDDEQRPTDKSADEQTARSQAVAGHRAECATDPAEETHAEKQKGQASHDCGVRC